MYSQKKIVIPYSSIVYLTYCSTTWLTFLTSLSFCVSPSKLVPVPTIEME